jgi:predicted DNA-binding transcriptional regulator AlpA
MSAQMPYTQLMMSNEIHVLRCLHGMLENDHIESRVQFNDLMKAAFMYGKLDSKLLSDDLGYSASTVYRWIDGHSAPHPSLWPRISEWIKTAIENKIGVVERRSELAAEHA